MEGKEFRGDALTIPTARDQESPTLKGAARVRAQPHRGHATLANSEPPLGFGVEHLDERPNPACPAPSARTTRPSVGDHAAVGAHAGGGAATDEYQQGLRLRAAAAAAASRAKDDGGASAALVSPRVA